jgi:anti-sigma factor ChrR (cupin superfamily)
MTGTKPTSRHPSMGVLLRRLDGELGDAAEAKLSRHLQRCDACRARAEELEEHARIASRYLQLLPAGEGRGGPRDDVVAAMRGAQARRRPSRVHRGWAAAAAIVGLLAISMTVDPLRAWVLTRLAAVASPVEQPMAPIVALPTAVVGADGSVIAFEATGGVFDLQLERHQMVGEIFVQVRNIGRATAQVTNSGDETMLVLPSGLRIENGSTSSASYRVTLPTSVDRLVLRVGDEAPRVLEIPEDAGSWSATVPLRE